MYTQGVIYFLHGSDTYRRARKLREIVAEYRKKHAVGSVLAVDLEETPDEWTSVRDYLRQPSMFDETKIAVVKESAAVVEALWIEALRAEVKTPKTFLVISDAEAPEGDRLFLTESPVVSQEFPRLSGRMLEAFLKREADGRSLTFMPDAWALLLTVVGAAEEPTWFGTQELEKIALAGFPSPVARHDLARLVEWFAPTDLFSGIRRIMAGRSARERLPALEALLVQGEAPARIFNTLGYQSQGRLAVSLADYDVAVKRGKLEYEEVLTDFALR
ncbi:MAG: hypothetical protein AAB601_01140 [Patescibacteria group bacterium]